MALMYLEAAEREATPSRQRDLLHRAQAYAQAALRDFQHYQGRAAQMKPSPGPAGRHPGRPGEAGVGGFPARIGAAALCV